MDVNLNEFSNPAFEKKAIKSLLLKNNIKQCSKNLDKFVNLGLDQDCFTGDYRPFIVDTILKFKETHNNPISRDLLLNKIKKRFRKNDDVYSEAKIVLDNIYKAKIENREVDPIYTELKTLNSFKQLTKVNNEFFLKLKELQDDPNSNIDPKILATHLIDKTTSIIEYNEHNKIREGDPFQDNEIIEDLERRRQNPEENKGIPTGFEILTKVTNGWNPGELILVAGRPGQGKSILLMNFAYNAYLAGSNVLFFTLEMPYRQQSLRLFSKAFNLPYIKLKVPSYMDQNEWDLFINEMKRTRNERKEKDNVFKLIDAPEQCTMSLIEHKITEFERTTEKDIDLVVIDPLYLMKPTGSGDRREKDDPVGMLSGEVKILAMNKGIPIISATQINREGGKRHQTGKDPTSMDLAFTDRLAHNSDSIFIITSDFNDLAQLHIVKFRDGAGPKIYLRKNFTNMQFEYDSTLNDMTEITKYIEHMNPENL